MGESVKQGEFQGVLPFFLHHAEIIPISHPQNGYITR